MKGLLTCLLCLLSVLSFGQDTHTTSERIFVEAAINYTTKSSLSISIEKEFTYNRWKFGPRIELVNLFDTVQYRGGNDTLIQTAQVRLRLAQIEYQLNNHLRIGIAPIWMLGPLPRKGFYRTPTSIWAHIDLDNPKTLSLEVTLTNSRDQLLQLGLRKKF